MKAIPEMKKDKPNARSTGIYGADIEKEKTGWGIGHNTKRYKSYRA